MMRQTDRLIVLLVVTAVVLSACAAPVVLWQNYDTETPNELTITLAVRVHVVTNRAQLPLQRQNIIGTWQDSGDLWVIGTPSSDGIYPDVWALGHEFQHALHAADARIPSPDAVTLTIQR